MGFEGKYNHLMGRKHPIRHQISIRERERKRERWLNQQYCNINWDRFTGVF